MASNWSELPEELVSMVAERLVCFDDLIRLRAVCKPWGSVSVVEKQKKPYAPLLMLAKAENDNLPSDDNDDGKGMMRSFVIPYDGGANTNKMRSFDIELPKAQGKRCWGSPYGWVVTIGLDFNIHLLNPFTGEQIPLPPQPILQHQSLFKKILPKNLTPDRIISAFIRKFALAWHQPSQCWLVMAIFGNGQEVAFTFTGIGNESSSSSSSSWTCIESSIDTEDVILFQDQIFMITRAGELRVCDIKESTPPKAIEIATPPKHLDVTDTFYLVEMGGKLYFVVRFYEPVGKNEDHRYVTTGLAVLRFSFRRNKWYEVDGFGKYAVFVGNNTSFAISTTIYPHFLRNFIYFTDDHYIKPQTRYCDMGVFSYKEERIVETFHNPDMGAFFKFSRPLFFMPTL